MTGDDAAGAAALAPADASLAAAELEEHAVGVDTAQVDGERAESPEFASFDEYFRADSARLVGFLVKIGAGVHDAADIAQNVLLDMWKKWDRIRSPRRWARDHATWTLYKKPLSARHEDLSGTVPDSAPSALLSPEHYVEVAESAKTVRALLAPLPEQQRLVMAYLSEGFQNREIAQAIRTTPAAVAAAAARARASLKDRILADRQSQEER